MSWAKFAIEKLKKGETIQIRPRGHSMKGKVNDGDLVTVAPCKPEELSVGDIVWFGSRAMITFISSKLLIMGDF